MGIEFIPFIVVLLLHLYVLVKSNKIDRTRKFVYAMLIMLASIILMVCGVLVGLAGNKGTKEIAYILFYAPVYLPIVSLLFYLPSSKRAT
ncbi:hypothetical protein SAMN02745866_01113 [Alteromonadaceae bacterium Bs31]|nr:hypothetical protein SAMN02745866_01113 [Alteromonadaceae bacterium Bs31]